MSDQISMSDLNKMVLFTKQLSELHIKNLQSFPWIYFNHLHKAHLDYNIASNKDEKSLIKYNLETLSENDFLDKRCKAIEEAVKLLFWKEMGVKILINNKEVYSSE